MNLTKPSLQYASIVLFSAVLLFACRKTASDTNEPGIINPVDTVLVSKLFERLQFNNPVKRGASAPGILTHSSLRKSFKDTLHLVDAVKIPVEFLHMDTTKNVAGLYVSYQGGSFYYVAAELQEAEENDTVSVILIGFDPTDLELPVSFNITLTPYDKTGRPIDQITVPVKMDKSNDDPNKPGICGLDLPPGDYWNWSMSYILDKDIDKGYSFMNYPNKVHGAGGQFIKGCCKDGKSFYNTICAVDTASQRRLHFPTFFQFPEESFNFSSNGTYDRTTIQETANPNPPASNFCGNGKGVVDFKSSIVIYIGKWSITSVTVPTDLKFFYTKRNYLTLQTTSSSGGGGYGNPGGILHYLDCRYLMLILPDREGGGQHLYKIYKRKGPNNPEWFLMT